MRCCVGRASRRHGPLLCHAESQLPPPLFVLSSVIAVASSAHHTAMQTKGSAFLGALSFSSFQTFSMLIFIAFCASVVLTSVHFVSTDCVGLWLHRTDPNLSVTVPPGMHLSAPQSVLKIKTAHLFSDFTFHSVQTSPQSTWFHKIPCQTGDGNSLVFRDIEITHQLAESAVHRNIGSGSSEYEHYLLQRICLKTLLTSVLFRFILGSFGLLLHELCKNFTARQILVGDMASMSKRLQVCVGIGVCFA
jgi:hypothetical protein